jgi:hypothetical protein
MTHQLGSPANTPVILSEAERSEESPEGVHQASEVHSVIAASSLGRFFAPLHSAQNDTQAGACSGLVRKG